MLIVRAISVSLLCLLLEVGIFGQSLDYFVNRGLENSPLLKDFQNQISIATIDSLIVKANQRPQVNLNAMIMKAPFGNNFGYDDAITNGGLYSSTVGVSQNFFNRKMLNNKYQSVDIQKQSIRNSNKLSTNDIKKAITTQYLTAYSDNREITFNEQFLKLIGSEKELLKQLTEHGVYKLTDYLAFTIEAQNQEILVNQLGFQLQKDIRLLKTICGINDTAKIQLNEPLITAKSASFSLDSSLLLYQFRIDSLKILNDKAAVDLRYKPKINWFADAGLISSDPSNLYQHFGFSIGVGFSLPIYDGKQRQLDYQKLSLAESNRENYKRFNTNQLSLQYSQLNEELNALQELEKMLNQQIKTSEELVSLSKAQLNAGNMVMTDFINALKNYININHNLNQVKVSKLQVMNELKYLLQQ